MLLPISDEDARDMEFRRDIEEARKVFLHATGAERPMAKGRYLKLLGAFSARVFGREPRISEA
jgi:hypothetical protein